MIAYIFKSSLSLIILFGLYWFLLRKEKFFIFNRYFLILSVILSLILPFITIPVKIHIQAPGKIITTFVNNIPEKNPAQNGISKEIQINQSFEEVQRSGIGISSILIILYISGVILFLLRFRKNIYDIFHRIKLSEKISFEGHRLILTKDQTSPYCFFNNIFIYKDDYLNLRSDDHLLNHELVHVRQYHSVDIVFIELIKIFYWFNPVFLLYERAIRINHEYMADHNVIREDCDIKSYADKILSFIVGESNIPLTSGSNHSFTKKRLLMMTKSRSKNIIYGFRITVTLCMILVFFFLLSFKQSNKELDSSGLIGLQSQTIKDIDGNVYSTITIGTQVWMAENLKTTRYNDGTSIPLVNDDKKWQEYNPAFCWYNNDEKTYKDKCGALYNWYAVNTNKLCPIGWHVPDTTDLWYTLFDYLAKNGYGYSGSGMKIAKSLASPSGWISDTIAGNPGYDQKNNNSAGFNGLPGGIRSYNGKFRATGDYGAWWSSSEYNTYVGKGWQIAYNYNWVIPPAESKRDGFSIRCLMDDSTKTSDVAMIMPEIEDVNFRNSDFTPGKALIVIDGVIIDYKGELKVNPGEIKSIKVLKDKAATTKYGEKGKDGVVEIILYGNKTESAGKKLSNNAASDTSKYITHLSINHVDNKGELIDIPVSNLQSVSVWTDHDTYRNDKKEFRTIGIMTRDYFKVKGRVVQKDGKPLSGVSINVSEEPVKSISDKEGRFVIEDVREDALLVFTCSGYKSYYLSMLFEVAFNMELTIKLEKD
jgi:uncharacterized protein (TIGR02145 family)